MSVKIEGEDVFAARLRQAREQRGLSQGDLARAAGLPASSISHFEAGARKPSFDNLRRIATALDITTDYLLGRVENTTSVGAAETIHRHLTNLSTSDLKLADDFIKLLAERNSKSGA